MVYNVAGSSLVKLSYWFGSSLLDQVTKKNRVWHTRDIEVAVGPSAISYVNKEQRKNDDERD